MSNKPDCIPESAISAFADLLRARGADVLAPGTYPHRYLQHILEHALYYSHVYARLLNELLSLTGRGREELVLVDYGTGNGLLGLMACYAGFGKVYLNDLDAGFLQAARELSAHLQLQPAGFIEGDSDQLLSFFADQPPPDVLAGSDVIEHIYNLEAFVQALHQLNPRLAAVLSTACNPANPLLRRRFRRIHLRDEFEGGTPVIHPLFAGAPIEPFTVTRRRIILESAGRQLPEAVVEAMVKLTRGLIRKDIETVVSRYLHTGHLPEPPVHPTNTCDPITGSWSERMLTLKEYRTLFGDAGFSISVKSGFYNEYEQGFLSGLRKCANRLLPVAGASIAPFILISARPAATVHRE